MKTLPLLAISLFCWGCGPSATTTAAHVKNAGDAAAYGVELTECRDKTTHPTQADYEACAKALDVKYGRTGS